MDTVILAEARRGHHHKLVRKRTPPVVPITAKIMSLVLDAVHDKYVDVDVDKDAALVNKSTHTPICFLCVVINVKETQRCLLADPHQRQHQP